jgi:hypothetical protein
MRFFFIGSVIIDVIEGKDSEVGSGAKRTFSR